MRELEEFFADLRARRRRRRLARRPARAHRRHGHPAAARRRAPRADARRRARRGAARSSPSTACRGSSASPTTFLAPLPEPYLAARRRADAHRRAVRLTISYFLAPSDVVDLGDADVGRAPSSPRSSQSSATSAPTGPASNLRRSHPMSVTHRDNAEILGRAELNDIEAIVSITNTDVDEVVTHRRRQRRRHLHVGLLARPAAAAQALREGQGRSVERHDRPAVGHRGRLRERGVRGPVGDLGRPQPRPLRRHGRREVGRRRSGSSSASTSGAGRCRSSSTASRARCCARRRSPRPCRGTTPSCTRRRRWSTRPATSRCSPATSTRSSAAASRSTPTCGCCSTTSSTTAAGT